MTEVFILQPSDLPWVNRTYAGIKFKESTEKDFLIGLTVDGKTAGLGRMVPVDERNAELGGIYVFPEFRGQKVAQKIVSFLIEKNTYPVLWCIPFQPLENFYRKFGFRSVTSEKIPAEIQAKLDWCQGRYPEKAILLVKSEE